jgi:hypothetical protein
MPIRDGEQLASNPYIESLNSGNDPKLSCIEEAVLRMHKGLDGGGRLAYERKPVSDDLYQRLLEIELRALEKTKRLEAWLDDEDNKL